MEIQMHENLTYFTNSNENKRLLLQKVIHPIMLLQPAVGLSAQAYSSSQAKFLSSAIAKVKLCTLFCSHNQLGKKITTQNGL